MPENLTFFIQPQKDGGSFKSIFYIFLKLGLISFGGPAAHIAYFREEFVNRRHWLNDNAYAQLVALCQFLPGPASSQVGFAIGLARGGKLGALAAWLGFTLPSALLLIMLALGFTVFNFAQISGVIAGLKIVAFAVIAQATWQMMQSLCATYTLRALMFTSALLAVLFSAFWVQFVIMLTAGIVGIALFGSAIPVDAQKPIQQNTQNKGAYSAFILFIVLLIMLPLLANYWPNSLVSIANVFYKAGALVFGGGHVVLPLLQGDITTNQWVDNHVFMAGYGLTQAMPGPLFTFAAFLGVSLQPIFISHTTAVQVLLGFFCLIVIFLPAFLVLIAALPFWSKLKNNRKSAAALMGVNAAVVGFLAATLVGPVGMSAITDLKTLTMSIAVTVITFVAKPAPWLIVLICSMVGYFFLG